MRKRNRLVINESQLRHIIRESIKNIVGGRIGGTNMIYGECEYDPYDRCLGNDDFYKDEERLEQNIPDRVFNVQFEAECYSDPGDEWTPPSEEFNGEVYNDDGAMDVINSIPDEEIRNFLIQDFQDWCDEECENMDNYDTDEPYDERQDYSIYDL